LILGGSSFLALPGAECFSFFVFGLWPIGLGLPGAFDSGLVMPFSADEATGEACGVSAAIADNGDKPTTTSRKSKQKAVEEKAVIKRADDSVFIAHP